MATTKRSTKGPRTVAKSSGDARASRSPREKPDAAVTAKETAAQPRDERRAELVAAAYAMIAEKGLEGIRTRDIAARAGVNISTLHYYFGTKEALLLAVVDHVRDMFTQRESAGFAATEETLREHLRAAWRSFQDDPQLAVVLQELVVRAQRDADTQAAFQALYTFWNGMVEGVLRRSIERRELRSDLDPRLGAAVVTSFIVGATAQLGVNPKAFDFEKAARELERLMGRRSDRES